MGKQQQHHRLTMKMKLSIMALCAIAVSALPTDPDLVVPETVAPATHSDLVELQGKDTCGIGINQCTPITTSGNSTGYCEAHVTVNGTPTTKICDVTYQPVQCRDLKKGHCKSNDIGAKLKCHWVPDPKKKKDNGECIVETNLTCAQATKVEKQDGTKLVECEKDYALLKSKKYKASTSTSGCCRETCAAHPCELHKTSKKASMCTTSTIVGATTTHCSDKECCAKPTCKSYDRMLCTNEKKADPETIECKGFMCTLTECCEPETATGTATDTADTADTASPAPGAASPALSGSGHVDCWSLHSETDCGKASQQCAWCPGHAAMGASTPTHECIPKEAHGMNNCGCHNHQQMLDANPWQKVTSDCDAQHNCKVCKESFGGSYCVSAKEKCYW